MEYCFAVLSCNIFVKCKKLRSQLQNDFLIVMILSNLLFFINFMYRYDISVLYFYRKHNLLKNKNWNVKWKFLWSIPIFTHTLVWYHTPRFINLKNIQSFISLMYYNSRNQFEIYFCSSQEYTNKHELIIFRLSLLCFVNTKYMWKVIERDMMKSKFDD